MNPYDIRVTLDSMDRTKRVIARMLTDNTGASALDSGSAYGRNWERNQGRDFESEPPGTLRFSVYQYNGHEEVEIEAALSVYHWLGERLEYVSSLDRRFRRWATRPSRADEPWLVSAEQFVTHLGDDHQITGLYNDGTPFTVNTYNGEDMLSQTIQFVYFEMDGDPYVLLQVHGGCDVRGGYTRPYAFRVTTGEGSDILDNAAATIYCTGEGAVNKPDPNQLAMPDIPRSDFDNHYWRTDDTSHWYCQSGTASTQLEEYDTTENPDERGTGRLYIDDDGNGHCPKCGGRLALGSR